MHDQRNPAQDTVLRAQIAMANRLIAEQSATIARAHSAIERAMETLRRPDGERSTGGFGASLSHSSTKSAATSPPAAWAQTWRPCLSRHAVSPSGKKFTGSLSQRR
jgi:hypothetical protein